MHRLVSVIKQQGEAAMKHLKIILVTAIVAVALNTSFADPIRIGNPAGWTVWGPTDNDKYEIGIDTDEGSKEHPALYIASKSQLTDEVAAITQTIDGTDYQGQVIEFSLMARATGAAKNKIWLRHMRSGGDLEMKVQVIPDGRGWEKITLKSYLPQSTDAYRNQFEIGIALASQGKIWVRDLKLEKHALSPIPDKFPTPTYRSGLRLEPPRNLNFTE